MIWDVVREDGYGQADVYITFRAKGGSWLPAMNMGDKINTELQESSGRVTDDGKYLFFARVVTSTTDDPYSDIDIFWVDAQIIETFKPQQ